MVSFTDKVEIENSRRSGGTGRKHRAEIVRLAASAPIAILLSPAPDAYPIPRPDPMKQAQTVLPSKTRHLGSLLLQSILTTGIARHFSGELVVEDSVCAECNHSFSKFEQPLIRVLTPIRFLLKIKDRRGNIQVKATAKTAEKTSGVWLVSAQLLMGSEETTPYFAG